MKVVNIRTTKEPFIYIGRAGHGQNGYFGNPYSLQGNSVGQCQTNWNYYFSGWCDAAFKEDGLKALAKVYERGQSLKLYQNYLSCRMEEDEEFRTRLFELRDKGLNLGCFCAPKEGLTLGKTPWICHGQVILYMIDDCPF